ncbi:MAG: glycosyltransferase, partial [Acidobacteriota bacterium]
HRPSPLMMRAARGIAQVVSIHDALPLVPAAGFTAGARWLWRQRARRAARTAARVQTLSETARGALVRGLRLDPARIDGVGAGVDVDPPVRAATLPDALPQRYVLHVGARRPHKRIGFLLDAWESLVRRERTAGHGLVLAGPRGRSTPQLRTQAERAGLLGLRRAIADRAGRPGAATVFAHDPDDAELDALYRGASLLVMPSLVEGFGLPLAEAMARDVAVVCADGPGMTEVVGDAGVRFLPRSVGDLVQQLDDLLHDDDARAALVVRGRARVERHAWPRVAERTLASYRRALGDG